jgi:hypothetical protein
MCKPNLSVINQQPQAGAQQQTNGTLPDGKANKQNTHSSLAPETRLRRGKCLKSGKSSIKHLSECERATNKS